MGAQVLYCFTAFLMIFVSLARSSNVKNVTDIDSGRVVVKGNYNAVNLYPDKGLNTVLSQLQRKIESLEGRMDALEKSNQGISCLLIQFSLNAKTYLRCVALCIQTFLMRSLFAGNTVLSCFFYKNICENIDPEIDGIQRIF